MKTWRFRDSMMKLEVGQTRIHAVFAILFALTLLASGCASGGGNTLAQDLAWERWTKCNDGSMRLLRIERDGQVWAQGTTDGGAPLPRWQACMREAAALQGKQGASRPAPVVAASPAVIPATGTTIQQWKPGDEWAYRWESPQGSGTFVWSMDREETVDGVVYYVVKSGSTRELYYRKSDFAYYMEKVNGQVENRHTPPTPFFAWPLVSGAKMEVRFTRERPFERQTEAMALACETGPLEPVTVQAGTFDAVKVACRNTHSGTPNFEAWLSPAVKRMVRERTHFSYGVRERELIRVKLR